MVATRLGAMVAAASAIAAAVGLRLCGMVEEPPRPGAAGSNASATSVCISSETSRAILPQVPVRIANAAATSASRSRWPCQGASGSGRSSSAASRSETSSPRSPSAASVPAAPPNCSTSASLRSRRSRSRERAERRRIARELEPERHRQRVLQPGARDRGGAAVAPGERGEGLDGAVEIGDERVDRGAQFEHQRGVDDVLAGRAPVHVARGLGIGLGDLGGERLDQRDRDVAGGDRRFAERGEVVALGAAGGRDRIDRRGRDDADRRLGARQRHLEIEHALQPRAIIEDRTHGRARESAGSDSEGGRRWDWSSARGRIGTP